MSPLSTILRGLALGVLFSIPPGTSGAIILNLSLRNAKRQALRALAAFLLVELIVMGLGLGLFGRVADLAALPFVKPAAGVYLLGFAVVAWRAAGSERGFTETSAFTVFKISLLNPMIWIGAVATLTLARTAGGAGLWPALEFVAGFEFGSVLWYVLVILASLYVPPTWRKHIERAAVLIIAATGAWLIFSSF